MNMRWLSILLLAAPTAFAQEPPAAEPPAVEPPAVEPPAAEPPAVEPPAVEPAAVEPAAVEPPAVEPPAVEPPAVDPAAVDPTAVDPAAVDPAATETAAAPAAADEAPEEDTMTIVGRREQVSRLSGSAHAIGEKALEVFESNDIHQVLSAVPGVYVRGEDGFGLRPNIGLRGANSNRSAKVTLLEDGVLLAPAPYAAPAAYFFPQVTRMTRVEVFKGPAAIQHGPNTVGGAINLTTRPIPYQQSGQIDLSIGRFNTQKTHGWVGGKLGPVSVLIEGLRLSSDGFKALDGGGPTGFLKNEVMAKIAWESDYGARFYQRLQLKAGYADERSNETYTGLTEADADSTPLRRYAGTQLDLMKWERTQLQLDYDLSLTETIDLAVTAYRHDFQRSWRKLNAFRRADLHDVLNYPDDPQLAVYLSILRGEADSDNRGETLLIGDNDRTYVSQGLRTQIDWTHRLEGLTSRLEVGARVHTDSVERTHTEEGYLMRSAQLVSEGTPAVVNTRNRGQAKALAVHALDELKLGDSVYLTPGGRMEWISTALINRLDDDKEDTQSSMVFLGGMGAYVQATPWLGVLAGVHQGFSPVAPGQGADIEPERSVNYEAGIRLAHGKTRAEAIGFWNAYTNLTAQCTFSSGCEPEDVGTQFNGGAVDVYGVETLLKHKQPIGAGWQLTGELAYTLTRSAFKTDFESGNAQFGTVEEGDALAYVPEHQGRLALGADHTDFGLNLAGHFTGVMRDVPGSGAITGIERIESRFALDAAAYYRPSDAGRIYLTLSNALDNTNGVSRRPFGVRPAMPLNATLGYKHHFGG